MTTQRKPPVGAVPRWLFGIGVIVAFAAAGNAVQAALHLPIPGSTIGMIALLILLLTPVRGWLMRVVAPAADSLIAVLPLLLVPLAVGVVGSFGTLAEHALAIVAALVIGWLVTFLSAALISNWLMRRVS